MAVRSNVRPGCNWPWEWHPDAGDIVKEKRMSDASTCGPWASGLR